MSRLPLFWGASSDRDFADGIHAADGSSQEPVTLCQACGVLPAQRTGLVSARALCLPCSDVEADISVEQLARRIRQAIDIGERLTRRVG